MFSCVILHFQTPTAAPPAEQQPTKEEEKKDVEEKKSEEAERVRDDKTAGKKSQCCNSLVLWMNENPDMVRPGLILFRAVMGFSVSLPSRFAAQLQPPRC